MARATPCGSLYVPVLLLAALLVPGCASTRGDAGTTTSGPDPRPLVDGIALCRTTEAELRERFGAPTRDGRLHRARVLSWITGEDDAAGVTHYLAVLLDDAGTVVDLYWDLPTEIPWTPIDQCKR